MAEYFRLIARAVSRLEKNTSEARRALYDHARRTLDRQLRAANPPLPEFKMTGERLFLENAIRDIESTMIRGQERLTDLFAKQQLAREQREAERPRAEKEPPHPRSDRGRLNELQTLFHEQLARWQEPKSPYD